MAIWSRPRMATGTNLLAPRNLAPATPISQTPTVTKRPTRSPTLPTPPCGASASRWASTTLRCMHRSPTGISAEVICGLPPIATTSSPPIPRRVPQRSPAAAQWVWVSRARLPLPQTPAGFRPRPMWMAITTVTLVLGWKLQWMTSISRRTISLGSGR